MAFQIKPAVGGLLERLFAAGYAAAVDPAQLTPPGVWVQPRSVVDPTLGGGGTLVCWLYLVVQNVEADHALTLLDDLLEGLDDLELALNDDEGPALDLTAAVLLPSDPTNPLPAYRLAVDLEL